jgi:hypothetical protein
VNISRDYFYGFQFEATVVNNGPNWARNVVVTATVGALYARDVFVSASVPCTVSSLTITCTKLALGTGTIKIGISFVGVAIGLGRGYATVSASSTTPDPNTANNSATGIIVFHCTDPYVCMPR